MNALSSLRHVYILDDDEAVRSSLQFFLASAGFLPRSFSLPDAFLTEVDTLSPGCVLVDIRMPGLDGFQVLDRLETRRAVLPAVVMTGHGDIAAAVRAMKAGASDFIEKPFEEDVLLEILDRVRTALATSISDLSRRDDIRSRLNRLTGREREVLASLVAGRPNKLIAYELNISVRTVEMHRAAMMERLGVRTFAEALRLAIESRIDGVPPVPTRVAGAA